MTNSANECWLVDLGLIGYEPACELQRRAVEARKADAIPDVLLLCEHPHVITLGRNGRLENLRASDSVLRQKRVEFHPSDRGGDITYHGPGQIVGYPILDLASHRRDVRWYVDRLEETMIRATREFGIEAKRIEGLHGIWVDALAATEKIDALAATEKIDALAATEKIDALAAPEKLAAPAAPEKLAALGVHLSRWVTSHGFAYNVSTDLRYFDLIVPCGISEKRATSLEKLLGCDVNSSEVAERLARHFGEVFGRDLTPMSRDEFEAILLDRSDEAMPLHQQTAGMR
ncbi:MAG: lipoyl(octanoyl) transferase LipB [Candidatus Acidiferrales bacterium]